MHLWSASRQLGGSASGGWLAVTCGDGSDEACVSHRLTGQPGYWHGRCSGFPERGQKVESLLRFMFKMGTMNVCCNLLAKACYHAAQVQGVEK